MFLFILCFNTSLSDTETTENINWNAPPETTSSEAKPISKFTFDTKRTAETIVNLTDGFITSLGVISYSYAVFTPEDRLLIRKLKAAYNEKKNGGKAEVVLDEHFELVYNEYEEFTHYEKTILPLSEKEKQSLIDPISAMMEEANFNPSPKKALLISTVLIVLPRLIPISIKFAKRLIGI